MTIKFSLEFFNRVTTYDHTPNNSTTQNVDYKHAASKRLPHQVVGEELPCNDKRLINSFLQNINFVEFIALPQCLTYLTEVEFPLCFSLKVIQCSCLLLILLIPGNQYLPRFLTCQHL